MAAQAGGAGGDAWFPDAAVPPAVDTPETDPSMAPRDLETGLMGPRATGRPQPGVFAQTGLVVKKNVLLKSRNCVGLLLEILFPMLFLCVLLPVWAATEDDEFPDQSFVGSVLNQTEYATANLTCRRHLDNPNLTAYQACPEVYPEHNCIGGLCVMLDEDDDAQMRAKVNPLYYPFSSTLPDYDTVALLRRFASEPGVDLPGWDGRGTTQNVANALSSGWHVAVVPDNADNAAAVQRAADFDAFLERRTLLHGLNRKSFDNEADAMDYTFSRNGSQTVWAVVVMSGEGAYKIRTNRTAVPRVDLGMDHDNLGFDPTQSLYISAGFTTLQALVNEFITGHNAQMTTTVYPFPTPAYKNNAFLTGAGGFLPLLLALSLLYPVAQLVAAIVREKEARIREAMLIMGLSLSAFRLSWILTVVLQLLISSVLVTIPLAAAFLSGTPYTIILLLSVLYGLAISAYVIFMSVLFAKSSTAVVVAPFAFFAQAMPSLAIDKQTTGKGVRTVLSMLLPTSAFDEGYTVIMGRASIYEDLQWEEIGDAGDIPVSSVYVLLLFSCAFYLFLAWYLDETLKGDWGSKRPWYFLCWPPLWCGGKSDVAAPGADRVMNPHLVEPQQDASLSKQVEINSLRKVFPSATSGGRERVAVDNVNLSLYEGQILSLLGHNGAGKTTLINLITGMLPTSGGDASVYGASIHGSMNAVRQNIGLCPQHNILWDYMTCAEHLRFFAALKGVPEREREAAIDAGLRDIHLSDKKDVYSSELSGGMKRKLCVEIALIGGSKLVILDEPTAGMDVEARRAVWDILKAARKGRTVLLTTHFMDEADILGDSIAIMTAGRVYCWGSSYFLKQHLGVGYQLKMEVEAGAHVVSGVEALMRQELGGLQGSSTQKIELLSHAGSECSFRLPSWGVPKFAHVFERFEREGGMLGIKNFSIGLTTLEEIFLKIANETEGAADDAPSPPGTPAKANGHSTLPSPRASTRDLQCPEKLEGGSLYTSQLKALFTKRIRYVRRDRCTLCLQVILPVMLIQAAFQLGNFPVEDPKALEVYYYPDGSLVPVAPATSPSSGENVFTQYLSDTLDSVTVKSVSSLSIFALNEYLLNDHYARRVRDKQWHAYHADNATGAESVFYNTSSYHSIAVGLSQQASVRWREATGNTSKQIAAVVHPFPFSDFFLTRIDGWKALTTAVFVLIPFVFIPASYLTFLVKERVQNIKHVQIVSGLRLGLYWATNFLFDLFTYSLTVLLALSLFFTFGKDEYIGDAEAFVATVMLFMCYALTAIASSYLASFYFDNATTGQNLMMIINFLTGFVLSTVVTVLEALGYGDTANTLRFVFRLVPSYCLGDGLVHLSMLPTQRSIGMTDSTPFSLDIVGWDIIFLLLAFPVYFLATVAHDFPQTFCPCRNAKGDAKDVDVAPTPGRDMDVVEEERAIMGLPSNDKSRMVTVKHLVKVYPSTKKVAVRDVTFGIKLGEIFAFLGTNGAGKTTTISILAGERPPTGGEAFIKQHNVVKQPQDAKRELGYCPQFDALIDTLTPREHLYLYSGLRGVPYAQRDRLVDALLDLLDLENHQNTLTKSLSGGNKRKTSIAVALIGGPACVLLDEPTAGMDPLARRAMWKTLQMISEGRSVLLTTHHLEEVEALAQRMAIMVDGEMQCVGSLSHLRAKFGGAYEVQVRTGSLEAEGVVKNWFAGVFRGATLLESTNLRLTYRLPAGVKLSDAFRLLQTNQKALGVVDYAISETSIEQVFTAICRRHEEKKDAGSPKGDAAGKARHPPGVNAALAERAERYGAPAVDIDAFEALPAPSPTGAFPAFPVNEDPGVEMTQYRGGPTNGLLAQPNALLAQPNTLLPQRHPVPTPYNPGYAQALLGAGGAPHAALASSPRGLAVYDARGGPQPSGAGSPTSDLPYVMLPTEGPARGPTEAPARGSPPHALDIITFNAAPPRQLPGSVQGTPQDSPQAVGTTNAPTGDVWRPSHNGQAQIGQPAPSPHAGGEVWVGSRPPSGSPQRRALV